MIKIIQIYILFTLRFQVFGVFLQYFKKLKLLFDPPIKSQKAQVPPPLPSTITPLVVATNSVSLAD